MEREVKNALIKVLKDSIYAIKKRDLAKLRSQSDTLLNDPITFQDEQAIGTAILLYSIFKVIEKHGSQPDKIREFNKILIDHFKVAIKEAKQANSLAYNSNLKTIIRKLNKIEKHLNLFIEEGIKLTKVKKASKIYSQGVSLGTVTSLLKASKWDVMRYSGKTPEQRYRVLVSPIERIKHTEVIFNTK